MAGTDSQSTLVKEDAAHPATMVAIRVVCEDNAAHPMTGLFVLWAPLDPSAPSGGGGASSSRANSPEEKILQIAAERDPIQGPFSVGFVDKRGYLQPARIDVSPWLQIYSDNEPRTHKLVPGTYRFCLVRHPSPTLAFDLASELNSTKPFQFDVERWGGEKAWEDVSREELVQNLELKAVSEEKGADLVLELPEPSPGADVTYWPKGNPLYKGVTLYEGMPHLHCRPVREQVVRLQSHLGALRFPAGHQYTPYFTDPTYDPNPDTRTATSREQYYNGGLFDMRTAAALAGFQERAKAGDAWKVQGTGAEQHKRLLNLDSTLLDPVPLEQYKKAEHWAYLLADPVTAFPEECKLASYSPAFADWRTAEAIKNWVKNLFRKPGPLLVGTVGMAGEQLMLREEAAVQLEFWRLLHELFECGEKVLPSGHIFRSVSMVGKTGNGWLNNSIHKSGLAIDLACDSEFIRPMKGWTIRFEHRKRTPWSFPRVDAQKNLDDAKARLAAAREIYAADCRAGARKPKPARTGVSPDPSLTADAAKKRAELAKTAADAERKKVPDRIKQGMPQNYAYAGLIELDEAWIAALEQEVAQREKALQGAIYDEEVTKTLFRMRWCIYGPSTIDAFGTGVRALQTKLRPVTDGAAASRSDAVALFEERLLKKFPAAVREDARAWVRKVMEDYAHATALCLELSSMTAENLQATFFREWLRPFLFDTQQVDGGQPVAQRVYPAGRKPLLVVFEGGKVVPWIPDDIASKDWSKGNYRPIPNAAAIKSYVNLTELAIRCGLLPIGTAGPGWKQRLVTANPAGNPEAFAAFVDLMVQSHDHPDSKDLAFVVERGKKATATLPLAKLDIDALQAWRDLLRKVRFFPEPPAPKPGNPPKGTPSRCFRSSGAQLTFTLPGVDAKSDGDRLLSALQGALAQKRFRLTCADKNSRFATLHGLSGKELKGSALRGELSKAVETFHKELEELKKGLKPPPPLPALPKNATQKQIEAAEREKAAQQARLDKQAYEKLLKSRTRSWLEVTIEPSFLKDEAEKALDGYPFLPGDVVYTPGPGVARTLEWWHHQSKVAYGPSWGELMTQLGYSSEVLTGVGVPADYGSGHYEGRRLGYTLEEMLSTNGGMGLIDSPKNVFLDDWK